MPDVWPAATATGLGPFPGVDPLEAARIVFSELPAPALPFLPELPARGVGSDPIGRTAGLLADLHVEVGTGAWRFVTRPGRDEQRAHAALVTDLDAVEEAAEGYEGPLKVRIVGPWTLAASVELRRGEKALADEGATRDVTASLAEGLGRHLADLRRRLPGLTRIVVQADEPLLPAVVSGEIATASGWGRLRAYERAVVEAGLRQVLGSASRSTATLAVERDGDAAIEGGAGDIAGVWIGDAPLDGALLRAAGAAFIGMDGAVLDSVDEDEVGETIDAGVGLLVACVPLEAPERDPRPPGSRAVPPRETVEPVRSLWKRLGFPIGQLPTTVAVAPVEGLERLDRSAVPGVLQRTVEAARYLEESAAEEEP